MLTALSRLTRLVLEDVQDRKGDESGIAELAVKVRVRAMQVL